MNIFSTSIKQICNIFLFYLISNDCVNFHNFKLNVKLIYMTKLVIIIPHLHITIYLLIHYTYFKIYLHIIYCIISSYKYNMMFNFYYLLQTCTCFIRKSLCNG